MNFPLFTKYSLAFFFALILGQSSAKSDSEIHNIQSTRMSQALGVCNNFLIAEKASEWDCVLKLLDASITTEISDAKQLSLLVSIASPPIAKEGRITPEVFFLGKELDVCYVSYWEYDETSKMSKYTFFVLRFGDVGTCRVLFSQPSRLALLYSKIFRSFGHK